MKKNLRKSALLIVALALMMTFAGGIGAQDGMKSITTAFLSGDVPSIDPSIGTDTSLDCHRAEHLCRPDLAARSNGRT